MDRSERCPTDCSPRDFTLRKTYRGFSAASPNLRLPFAVPEQPVGHSVLFLGLFRPRHLVVVSFACSFCLIAKMSLAPLRLLFPQKFHFCGSPFFACICHRQRRGLVTSSLTSFGTQRTQVNLTISMKNREQAFAYSLFLVEMTGFEPAATVCGARTARRALRAFPRAFSTANQPSARFISHCERSPSVTSSLTSFGTQRTQVNPIISMKKEGRAFPTFFFGRDDRIRTCGLFVPNEARYQTALHLDI